MSIFVMQAGEQNVAVGQHLNLAAHGFEARLELPDYAALIAECQVRRAIFEQTGQAKAAAVRHSDLCRHQQLTV
ncbi:hypothetical protein D9M71_840270 [compost metagenome]